MSSIPSEIRTRVLAKAANDWPDDFEMQKFTVEKQVESYIELQRCKQDYSEEEFSALFDYAASQWPDDFEMELHTFKAQLEAGIAFFTFEAPDVPPDILKQIRQKAFSTWPDDHEMQLHTLEQQVNAWRALNSM